MHTHTHTHTHRRTHSWEAGAHRAGPLPPGSIHLMEATQNEGVSSSRESLALKCLGHIGTHCILKGMAHLRSASIEGKHLPIITEGVIVATRLKGQRVWPGVGGGSRLK